MERVVPCLNQTPRAPHITRASPVEQASQIHVLHIPRLHTHRRHAVVADEARLRMDAIAGSQLRIGHLGRAWERQLAVLDCAVVHSCRAQGSKWEIGLIRPRRSREDACVAGDADDDFGAGKVVLEEIGDGAVDRRSSRIGGQGVEL